jgi:hypothetical protein
VRRTRLEVFDHIGDARAGNPRKHDEACVAVRGEIRGPGVVVKVMAISNALGGYIRVFVWRVVYSQKARAKSGIGAFVVSVPSRMVRKHV